jgi:hypothetical protein
MSRLPRSILGEASLRKDELGRIDGNEMSAMKHTLENQGAKAPEHSHQRHHFWRHAHRDWRVWIVVLLMLALVLVYVMTDNLSLRPGKRPTQPTPAINAP